MLSSWPSSFSFCGIKAQRAKQGGVNTGVGVCCPADPAASASASANCRGQAVPAWIYNKSTRLRWQIHQPLLPAHLHNRLQHVIHRQQRLSARLVTIVVCPALLLCNGRQVLHKRDLHRRQSGMARRAWHHSSQGSCPTKSSSVGGLCQPCQPQTACGLPAPLPPSWQGGGPTRSTKPRAALSGLQVICNHTFDR